MKKAIVITSIGIVIYFAFTGVINKVKSSPVYNTAKEAIIVGKEFANELMNKDIFIDNELVKINEVNITRHISTMVVNFLVENKSPSSINIALEDVKVNGISQRVHESGDGTNSVKGDGEDLFASYALLDVDLGDESSWDKEFEVEGYIVIQDYNTKETLDKYSFSKIYNN